MNPPLQAWTHVTGWTLIHFVWQGGLLALVVRRGIALVPATLVGGAVRDRVRRLDGDARRARDYRRNHCSNRFRHAAG